MLGDISEVPDDEELMALREDDLDDAFALEAGRKTEKKFMSIILNNLHINYEGWRAELPKEEEVKEEEETKVIEDGAGGDDGDTKDEEAETVGLEFVVYEPLSLAPLYMLECIGLCV